MKTTFIGGGNMATALIGGLTARGSDPGDFNVVEPVLAQRDRFRIMRLDAIRFSESALVIPNRGAQVSLRSIHLACFLEDVPHTGDEADVGPVEL